MRLTAGTLGRLTLGLLLLSAPLSAQLSGQVFHDRDLDGLPGPADPPLEAQVEIVGFSDLGGPIDLSLPTDIDGRFATDPGQPGDGCYGVRVNLPAGFRATQTHALCSGAGLGHPVGTRRYSVAPGLVDAVRSGQLLHIALGDSIAEPASLCTISFPDNDRTDYIGWLAERLACLVPSSQTRNDAIGGKLSADLLEPAGSCGPPNLPHQDNQRCDNIFDAIAAAPQLISISIGGNDWLGSEPADLENPSPVELETSVRALVETRQNLQEILSTLSSRLPDTDVVVNTVYDNLAGGCASPSFHNTWIPVWNQVLRDVVWAQGERFVVAEIAPEYANQDIDGANCCGEQGLICADSIHPNVAGAEVHLEKLWEALGAVALGARDALGTTENPDLLFGAVELLDTRWPSRTQQLGAAVSQPELVLARDDSGALIPAGDGDFVVSGFDAAPAGIAPSRVVVAVRYRTNGSAPAVGERDSHRLEASLAGSFSPPQPSLEGWNSVIPIVGASDSAPQVNALPELAEWREVRALLSRAPVPDGNGRYRFPSPDWSDLASLAVRLRGQQRGSQADALELEWDAVWLEIYGVRVDGRYRVYRSESALGLIDPANLLAATDQGSWLDSSPLSPLACYAVDDGSGSPALIQLVKAPQGGVTISWP